MTRDTTLRWGPTSTRLPDLLAFRDRLVIYCATARAKQDTNRFYRAMLPGLEHELAAISDQIDRKQTKRQHKAVSAQAA